MKTMDTPRREAADGPTPKKLRQALLPFQIISPVGVSVGVSSASKKRKLSDEIGDVKLTKSIRTENQNEEFIDLVETKENVDIKSQKHETPSDSGVASLNVEKLLESNSVCIFEEESICLKLDSPTRDCEMTPKEKENSPSVEPAADVDDATSKVEIVISHDDDEQAGNTTLETESVSENKEETGTCKIENTAGERLSVGESLGDSDAKASHSGSEELSEINTSTTSQVPTTPNQPVAVPKKKLLSSKMKEQREKIKQERERKKVEKRKEKEQEREGRLLQKKRELQEKKEQLQKRLSDKMEEKQKREEEKNQKKKQKEEEKQKREEERLKKEEERLKKEEERLKKEERKKMEEEEKEKRKGKAAAAFVSFFVPKKNSHAKGAEEQQVAEEKFMPFMVKGDMRLAPIVREKLSDEAKRAADIKIADQSEEKLYLTELNEKTRSAKTFPETWPLSDLKDDIVIVGGEEDEDVAASEDGLILDTHSDVHLRAKLLQFCENQRPPYWGTWRKKSSRVRPRRPFFKDDKYFDYEVDSDDEWEEEEPGESLHGSDDEKESEDEYEVDNEFFVPHGYLSNEEAVAEEAEDNVMSPETQKAKLKLLGLEFEEEMKQKTKQIKPQLLGCYWINDVRDDHLWHQYHKIFTHYKAVMIQDSIPTSFTTDLNNSAIKASRGRPLEAMSSGSIGRKKSVFPQEAIPDLIRLVHGNKNNHRFMVMEFITHWKKKKCVTDETGKEGVEGDSPIVSKNIIAKLTTSKKIKEIASWTQWPEAGPYHGKYYWYVPEETRAQFNLTDLPLPNSWKYNLKPKKQAESKAGTSHLDTSPSSKPAEVGTEIPSPQSTKPHLITKFTKVISKEERLEQLKQMAWSLKSPIVSCSGSQETSSAKPNPVITEARPNPATKIRTSSPFTSIRKLSREALVSKPSPVNSTSSEPKVRKRVPLLVSVPCGQEIPKNHSLISSFLKQNIGSSNNVTISPKEDSKAGDGATAADKISKEDSSIAASEDNNCIILD